MSTLPLIFNPLLHPTLGLLPGAMILLIGLLKFIWASRMILLRVEPLLVGYLQYRLCRVISTKRPVHWEVEYPAHAT